MECNSILASFGSIAVASAPALAAQQVDAELARAMNEVSSGSSYDVVQHVAAGERAGDELWIAENRAHGLRASFRRGGVAIEARREGREPAQLELALEAWGRPGALQLAPQPRVSTEGAWIDLDRGSMVEWFYNGVEGVEHGFSVLAAPEAADDATGLEIRMHTGGTFAVESPVSDALLLRDACGASVLSYAGLRAWDATGRALDAHMLATGEWLSILVDDEDARYPLTIDPLVAAFDAKLLPSDGWPHLFLGSQTAIDRDTAVALGSGASVYGYNVVLAYVFVRSSSGWSQQARLEGIYGDSSIGDVAIDGDVLAFGENPLTGELPAWSVYERSGTTWTATYNGGGGNINTTLGLGVSVAGDRVAITDDLGGTGVTKVHARTPTWHVEQAFGPAGSVALRDDLLVMGTNPAPFWSNPQIRVYQRSGTTWSLLDTPLSFAYGVLPVAIDDEDTIAVGDPRVDTAGNDAGAVYVLRRQGSSWIQWKKLLSPNFPSTAGFGSCVALDSGTLAVGVPNDNAAASGAGSVYLFRRNGGWTQSPVLVAFDAAANDHFGTDVALSGDRLLVGAPDDDDQGNNRGSSYVFTISSEAEVYCTAKVNSLGCLPEIDFTGTPSATSAAPFAITARQVLNNKMGVSFYGLNGRAVTPFQDGVRCVAPPFRRTPAQSSGGNPGPTDCSGAYAIDFNARIQSGIDQSLVAGARVDLQFWCRDQGVPSGTGLSDAIEFVIAP